MIEIGVTGTRHGLTVHQKQAASELLWRIWGRHNHLIVHHGDCVGADAEIAELARDWGAEIIAHPPKEETLRAWHDSDFIHPEKTYYERNRDIVDSSRFVWGFVLEGPQTGGTWYTIRYARSVDKPLTIVWPDGHLTKERQ